MEPYDLGPAGDPASGIAGPVDSSGIQLRTGTYIDEDGAPREGLGVEGAAYKRTSTLYENERAAITFDGSLFDVNGGLGDGETQSVGGQANFASAAIELRSKGTNTDDTAKIGFSEGSGAAARLHSSGDQDGDGVQERGFGFDAGPVGVDLKSEDPVRLIAQVLTGGRVGGSEQRPPWCSEPEAFLLGPPAGCGFEAEPARDPRTRANWTDKVLGDDTQGTRGAASSFGDMSRPELVVSALLNNGMRPERKLEILGETVAPITNLFTGLF